MQAEPPHGSCMHHNQEGQSGWWRQTQQGDGEQTDRTIARAAGMCDGAGGALAVVGVSLTVQRVRPAAVLVEQARPCCRHRRSEDATAAPDCRQRSSGAAAVALERQGWEMCEWELPTRGLPRDRRGKCRSRPVRLVDYPVAVPLGASHLRRCGTRRWRRRRWATEEWSQRPMLDGTAVDQLLLVGPTELPPSFFNLWYRDVLCAHTFR